MSTNSRPVSVPAIRTAFGVVAEKQTYKNLTYLALAFPLGFLYYVLLTFGFAFGAAFSVFLVGIAILIGTVVGARALAGFERLIANALLDIELERSDDIPGTSADGLSTTIRRYLEAPSTWRGLGFLTLKFWVGIVALVFIVLLVGAVRLLTAPVHYPYELELLSIDGAAIAWSIETLPEAILAVPIGAILAVVFLHLLNAYASVNERIAMALLGRAGGADEPATEPPREGATRTKL